MNNKKYILFWVMLLVSQNILAVEPPWYRDQEHLRQMMYAQTQREHAPDVLMLEVYKVVGETITQSNKRDAECYLEEQWRVKAVVTSIEKTGSGLTTGDHITINFRNNYKICPGSATYNPGTLILGSRPMVYLRCKQRRCGIAAGAWSFMNERKFQDQIKSLKKHVEQYRKQGYYK